MFSTRQLFSFLFIVLGKYHLIRKINSIFMFDLVVLALQLTNGIPVDSDASDESNSFVDESRFAKRRLPVEGILIGRRAVPQKTVVVRSNYPTEGILIGKRYPTEGILLGKRNFRFLEPKSMHENSFEN